MKAHSVRIWIGRSGRRRAGLLGRTWLEGACRLCALTGSLVIVTVVPAAVAAPSSTKALAASTSSSLSWVNAAEADWTGEQCVECHDVQVATFARGPHSALDQEAWAAHAGINGSCAGCHGDPTEHLSTEGEAEMYSFGTDATADSAQCMTCHRSDHPRFARSPHARTGMSCVDCHDVHQDRSMLADVPTAFRGRPSATCVDCHVEVAAQFSFDNHHRVEEGALECTSCHNPHEPQARAVLAGFKQSTCTECHSDKRGPWVFEHPASLVDGCTSCHAPHGSPNRHMLTFQSTAEVCFSCHAAVPGFHSRFNAETQCTNCHSQIHGSNLHPAFLK